MDNSEFERDRRELRERCERDFLFFCTLVFGEKTNGDCFYIEEHHKQTAKALTDCWNGKSPRLIISMPPGFGKTTMAIYYIAWSFLKNPKANYMYISYSEGLGISSSREIRDILNLRAVVDLWGERINSKESAKSWYVYQKSGGVFKRLGKFRVAPCDGQITGFDAGRVGQDASGGGIIIDDFMKELDARSEAKRKKAYETYEKTIRTRLRDGRASIIIIMQRLHALDVVGCLQDKNNSLKPNDPEFFKIIKIRAWDKKHRRPTCPRLIDRTRVQDLMKRQRFLFESQYQQEPENITNDFFEPKKIRRELIQKLESSVFMGPASSKMEYIVRGWDFNYSSSENSDWTVGIKLGYLDGFYYILDIFRERAINGHATSDLKTIFYKVVLDDEQMSGRTTVFQSIPDDPGYSIATEFARNLSSDGVAVHRSKDVVNKEVRWFPLARSINGGNFVYIETRRGRDTMEDEHKRREFFNELAMGSGGEHDDQIDALGRAFDYIQVLIKRSRVLGGPSVLPFVGRVYD